MLPLGPFVLALGLGQGAPLLVVLKPEQDLALSDDIALFDAELPHQPCGLGIVLNVKAGYVLTVAIQCEAGQACAGDALGDDERIGGSGRGLDSLYRS